MGYYAGIDLGATHVQAVVGDGEGRVLASNRRGTPQGPSGTDVTDAVLGTLRAACSDAGVDPGDVRAAGIGSIGPLDIAAGVVEAPANLSDGVDRILLTGPVEDIVGEAYLHNDAAAGVIGERFYRPDTPDDVVYLTVSSGIGAGICVDGNVLSGVDGNAGEVGHVSLDPQGRMRCGCGGSGHWEAYCSGANIPRYARHLQERDPVETDLPVAGEFGAPDVFDLAGEDPLADRVLDRIARLNAMGMATVVHAYAPAAVSVGGAVALNNPQLVLDPVRERLPDLVMTAVPDLELASLGSDAVVKGALASALTDGTGSRR